MAPALKYSLLNFNKMWEFSPWLLKRFLSRKICRGS
jgi:hypothetical protein